MRTTLLFEWRPEPLFVGLEAADSRHHQAPAETPINTTHVNPIDLLQGYVGVNFARAFVDDATARVTVGRQTLDLGSRRLVARNRFRNTINSFFGVHTRLSTTDDDVQLFALAPVERRPLDTARLRRNAPEHDRENFRVWLGGASAARRWFTGISTQAYVLGLLEHDGYDVPTSNRRLLTPGVRVHKSPSPGDWNFELELVGQAGAVRASRSPDEAVTLRHLAYFVHASGGYTLPIPAVPHVELLLDWASGDPDPTDAHSGRFDTLFGARRFDFGPTGIYGATARSNLLTPGGQVDVRPLESLSAFVAYRGLWLASARDAWMTTELSDPSGDAGRFVGHQLEVQLRHWLHAESLALETGVTQLWLGQFASSVAGAAGHGNPTYFYTELVLTL